MSPNTTGFAQLHWSNQASRMRSRASGRGSAMKKPRNSPSSRPYSGCGDAASPGRSCSTARSSHSIRMDARRGFSVCKIGFTSPSLVSVRTSRSSATTNNLPPSSPSTSCARATTISARCRWWNAARGCSGYSKSSRRRLRRCASVSRSPATAAHSSPAPRPRVGRGCWSSTRARSTGMADAVRNGRSSRSTSRTSSSSAAGPSRKGRAPTSGR